MTLPRMLMVAAVAGALIAGCASDTNKATGGRQVERVTLTLANPNFGDTDVRHWTRAVERLSRGTLRIDVRGHWRTGEPQPERGVLRDVRAGRVDAGMILSPTWDTLGVGSFRAFQAPLLVDSFELQRRVIGSGVGAAMLAGVRAAGVEPLGMLPGPVRHPVGIQRDLVGPDDYRGAQIATPPSAIQAATFRALGAGVSGVSTGIADGLEADLATLDFGDVPAHSVTADVALWPRVPTLVINRDVWKGLPEQQREALKAAARAAAPAVIGMERTFDRGGAMSLCGDGLTLLHAGADARARLRRAVEPVYAQLAGDPATRRALQRIRALKRELPPAPVPACGGPRPRPAAPAAGPLVGVWRSTVTLDRLLGAGEPAADADSNWGKYTLRLGADGRFEMRIDRFPDEPTRGTWSARRDVLVMVPSGSLEQGAGETWRYRWTVFRSSLVLRKLTVGPRALTVAPLHRP